MWEIGGAQAGLVFFFGVAETVEAVVEMDDIELMAHEDRLHLQREHWI
jgi:hypothetical protein